MQIHRGDARRPRPWAASARVGALALLAAAAGLLASSAEAGARPMVVHPTAGAVVQLRSLTGRRESRRRRATTAPRIAEAPAPAYAAPATDARFVAIATGDPKPKAQWQLSTDHGVRWRDIRGARGNSFSFIAVIAQDGDEFRAVFKNRHGKVATHAAELSVLAGYAKPVVETQPQSTTVVLGAEASFTAVAAGDPAPTAQWQLSENGGTTWTDVAGATQTTLTLTAATAVNGYEYRAVFTNVLGSTNSTAATLTVGGTAITEQPQSEDVASGYPVSFTATASGSPAPSIQWQVSTDHGQSWSNIAGATATTYSFYAAADQNLNEYQAVFTDALGTATTEPAILGVNYALTSNWSGYASVLNGFQYTSVSGTWTVPSVNCPGPSDSSSSQWVGIDGAASDTVEQVGTYSDCAGNNGTTPTYGAWYEMLGDGSVGGGAQVNVTSGNSYPVAPGDTMTAIVSVNTSDQWTLTISDSTSPRVWSFTAPPITWNAPEQASAEWIVERPESCIGGRCTLTSLADFGSATFTNASATANGTSKSIEALDSMPIEMIRSDTDSTLLAGPPTLNTAGDGFTEQWDASS
jgi:hypothetical protein